jgi:hypothetical protein
MSAIMETWDHILSPVKLAFECNALMRFVGALDAIFGLAGAWKVFDHLENTTRHIPADSRFEENNLSNLEFVGRHRFADR